MALRHILCFGDSLTWGWKPVPAGTPSTRYDYAQRWTGVMARALGEGYRVIEEGLSARTTSIDDPNDPRLDGSAYLPAALASHMPLDLVVIMLGTNDTKAVYRRTPHEIARGMARLVTQVAKSAGGVGTAYPAPALLIVAPPALKPIPGAWLAAEFEGAHPKSEKLAQSYRALAEATGAHFLDAGAHITTEGSDGVHFTPENNHVLGEALARKIGEIFA
ncbi:SGNH/GDSL hydrolase family protein [Asaia krungthepensis]|uniref:Lysophospholipase L1 n=1 Tax=Asaia krungthepensis NRIC 0535 TaxID=1307925 RepID=A0ABQ0PV98_9PROT|nr:SGNH/GDSL hydrolase family protein [Asaia krungthepensis]GBQ82511.1 lysophospholipase L1 [Asaia krungthepensis NRIC 0535]